MKKYDSGLDPHRYDDMLYMSRPRSLDHVPMTMEARAAQFAPFAALTGYDGQVKETGRLTEKKAVLDEDVIEKLNEKLRILENEIRMRNHGNRAGEYENRNSLAAEDENRDAWAAEYENADDGAAANEITISYFLPDPLKAGGKYVDLTGVVKKIDSYTNRIFMMDGTAIPIGDIAAIEGEIFSQYSE